MCCSVAELLDVNPYIITDGSHFKLVVNSVSHHQFFESFLFLFN